MTSQTKPGGRLSLPVEEGRPLGRRHSGRPGPRDQQRLKVRHQSLSLLAGVAMRWLMAVGAIGVVVVVVVVIVVVSLTTDNSRGKRLVVGSNDSGPVPSYVYSGFAAISPAVLAAAAENYSSPSLVKPTAIDGSQVSTGGKPTVLYMGAEYCPYCATERWPMVLALSQFGHFTNLTHIVSDDLETAPVPNLVPTFSFYRSSYTSPYLTFTPVELETRNPQQTLQTPTSSENQLLAKYDPQGSIPFVYINGKATVVGAEYDPGLLKQTGNFDDIANSIIGSSSALSANVFSDAGYITSNICVITGGKPGNVCTHFPKAFTK